MMFIHFHDGQPVEYEVECPGCPEGDGTISIDRAEVVDLDG